MKKSSETKKMWHYRTVLEGGAADGLEVAFAIYATEQELRNKAWDYICEIYPDVRGCGELKISKVDQIDFTNLIKAKLEA